MNLLLLTLALSTTAQDAPPAPPASANQQAFEASVSCASAHMVASVIVGQMGDTEQQAHLRRLADNFQSVSVGFGETLGFDPPSVVEAIAQSAAARVAPIDQMANAEARQAALAQWAVELNQQLEVCRQFAAKLSAN